MMYRQPGGIVGDLLLLLLRLNVIIRQQKQNKALLESGFMPLLLDAGNCCCRISRAGAVHVREAAVKTAEYIMFKLRNIREKASTAAAKFQKIHRKVSPLEGI
jgi:hypothetical protein